MCNGDTHCSAIEENIIEILPQEKVSLLFKVYIFKYKIVACTAFSPPISNQYDPKIEGPNVQTVDFYVEESWSSECNFRYLLK